MTASRWHLTHCHTVFTHIANTILGKPETVAPATLGTISLHPHQINAVARIERAIEIHNGALLADAVGLGKTYVALAVAKRYKHVHVIAPATLLPMWRSAFARAECAHASLHSLHSLSRKPLAHDNHDGQCLVIIDEAHHLRTRNTVRYCNAAQFVANRHVLLASATPLHNRPRDLQNLVALFLGTRADALDEEALAQFIIRRTSDDASKITVPIVREHAAFSFSSNTAVLDCLLALPPPLPARNGAAAGALIRLGLLRAWCSSDAALTHAVRKRQLRGEALLHSLAHGRYPTHHELHFWIAGHDSIQLGFPELLVSTERDDSAQLLAIVAQHLDALQRLLQLHTVSAVADTERTAILREMLQSPTHSRNGDPTSSAPIVAFSQFSSTVHALHRALSDVAGVASLTASGGRIASGAIARQELIAQFAPRAHERPPPHPRDYIQLLLTTDLLSEGVNLQDAGRLVHLDLPWTDAARAQRVGRIARLGSMHAFVDVYTFAPPPGIDATLRIVETLARKAGLAEKWIGRITSAPARASHSASARRVESVPEMASRLNKRLTEWNQLAGTKQECDHRSPRCTAINCCQPLQCVDPNETPSDDTIDDAFLVSHVEANVDGWIAVVELNQTAHVVSHTAAEELLSAATVPALSTAPQQLLRAIDAIDQSVWNRQTLNQSLTPGPHPVCGRAAATFGTHVNLSAHVDEAITALEEWHRDIEFKAAAGPPVRSVSAAHKLALRCIATGVGALPAALRLSIAMRAGRAERIVGTVRGTGAEQALEEWAARADTMPFSAWLDAASEYPALAVRGERVPGRSARDGVGFRLRSLLILVGDGRAVTRN